MIIFSIKIHHNGERGQSQDYDFNMDKVLTFGINLATLAHLPQRTSAGMTRSAGEVAHQGLNSLRGKPSQGCYKGELV
jgi:hypothetical protein